MHEGTGSAIETDANRRQSNTTQSCAMVKRTYIGHQPTLSVQRSAGTTRARFGPIPESPADEPSQAKPSKIR